MKIIKNILDLNKAIKDFKNFGFVPTMGGIHNGHISLIKNSQRRCKKTIVSIFVNPKQFNDKVDFKKYPRNLNKDINVLKRLKVDFLFMPEIFHMSRQEISSWEIHNQIQTQMIAKTTPRNHSMVHWNSASCLNDQSPFTHNIRSSNSSPHI